MRKSDPIEWYENMLNEANQGLDVGLVTGGSREGVFLEGASEHDASLIVLMHNTLPELLAVARWAERSIPRLGGTEVCYDCDLTITCSRCMCRRALDSLHRRLRKEMDNE
tara:strand:- start:25178 stop:25507 length:330 start_codon:yes stop_codon:yes gene_type:complete